MADSRSSSDSTHHQSSRAPDVPGTAAHSNSHHESGIDAYERTDARAGREEASEINEMRTEVASSLHSTDNARDGALSPTNSSATATVTHTPSHAPDVDLEKAEKAKANSLDAPPANSDPHLVTWNSTDDPDNPRNWPYPKRWVAMVLVSIVTFLSPLASSIVAPGLPDIAREFGITSQIESNLVLSVFILAFALMPLFLGPLSEIFGRRPIIQGCNLIFILFNMACALAQSKGQLTAFRFLAGVGGSAPLTVGGGTVADLFEPHERGKAMAVYSLAPLLGPAVGPIIGGALVQGLGNDGWRWAFGLVAIVSAVPGILGECSIRLAMRFSHHHR